MTMHTGVAPARSTHVTTEDRWSIVPLSNDGFVIRDRLRSTSRPAFALGLFESYAAAERAVQRLGGAS